jgi:hypothetical protein
MVGILTNNCKKILFVVFLSLSLFFLPITRSDLTEEAFTIIQEPSNSMLVINHSINVSVINNQAETISSISLFYCSLEPEFVCHFPSLQMEKNNQGHYSTVFTPDYEVNTIFGYHLEVNLENGSTYEIPDGLTYPSDYSIRQGSDDNYYFELQLVDSLSVGKSTPWLSIGCIFALTICVKKKDNKSPKMEKK